VKFFRTRSATLFLLVSTYLEYALRVRISNTLIIIPTFNEEKSIGILLSQLASLKLVDAESSFEVLIVDDNSDDLTHATVQELHFPWVELHVRPKKDGLGSAYKYGFTWAKKRGYEFVIEMDADGSHRVQDLPEILNASSEFDLVLGSRWVKGGSIVNWPIQRRIISKVGNMYAQIVLAMDIKDSTSGFRRMRLSSLNFLEVDSVLSKGYGFQVEVAYRFWKNNFRIKQVPIKFIEREFGSSKMTSFIALEAFLNIGALGIKRIFERKS